MAFYQRMQKFFNFHGGAYAQSPAQRNTGIVNPYQNFPRPVASVPVGNGSQGEGGAASEPLPQPVAWNPQPIQGVTSTPSQVGFPRPVASVPQPYAFTPGGESIASPVGHPLLPSPYRGGEM